METWQIKIDLIDGMYTTSTWMYHSHELWVITVFKCTKWCAPASFCTFQMCVWVCTGVEIERTNCRPRPSSCCLVVSVTSQSNLLAVNNVHSLLCSQNPFTAGFQNRLGAQTHVVKRFGFPHQTATMISPEQAWWGELKQTGWWNMDTGFTVMIVW